MTPRWLSSDKSNETGPPCNGGRRVGVQLGSPLPLLDCKTVRGASFGAEIIELGEPQGILAVASLSLFLARLDRTKAEPIEEPGEEVGNDEPCLGEAFELEAELLGLSMCLATFGDLIERDCSAASK